MSDAPVTRARDAALDRDAIELTRPPRETDVALPSDESSALDWRTRALVRVGTWVLFLLGWTWRVRVYGRNELVKRTPGDSRVVYSLWHGQLLPAAWAHRQRSSALVSEHRDGEIITRVVGRLGIGAIRGSSTRGGARALLECVTALRQRATDIVITPDGPRGPRHQFAPGALIVAFRAAAPIVPLTVHIDRAWRMNSWDQFEVPKPFARVTVYYGEPIPVVGDDVRTISNQTGAMEAAMQRALDRAAELARHG